MPPYEGKAKIIWWLLTLVSSIGVSILGIGFKDHVRLHERQELRIDLLEAEIECLRANQARVFFSLHLGEGALCNRKEK